MQILGGMGLDMRVGVRRFGGGCALKRGWRDGTSLFGTPLFGPSLS